MRSPAEASARPGPSRRSWWLAGAAGLAVLIAGVAYLVPQVQKARRIRAAEEAATKAEQARALMKRGRYDLAVPQLQAALAARPTDALIERDLGLALGELGRYSDSARHLERAVSLHADYLNLFGLGLQYERLGRLDDAARAFRRSARLSPEFDEAREKLCDAYLRLGRPRDALDEAQALARLRPRYARAHHLLALAYNALGESASARRELATVRELDPELARRLAPELEAR